MRASAVFWLVLAFICIHASAQELSPAGTREIVVIVHGEVRERGRYVLPESATALDAIAMAGGPTQDTDLSHVSLTRRGAAGKPHRMKINVKKESAGVSTPTVLQNGDVLFVRCWDPTGINL